MKRSLFLYGLMLTTAAVNPVRADDSAVPGAGFPASRYESLWTKSPFSVATSEESVGSSPDYMLVGIAEFDGISYASLIDKQNQEHFLVSSDKPSRGITLKSINRGQGDSDTLANFSKDGQTLTLKLEQPPATAAPGVNGVSPVVVAPSVSGTPSAVTLPPGVTQQVLIAPGVGNPAPGTSSRPMARFRRPQIHLPAPPAGSSP